MWRIEICDRKVPRKRKAKKRKPTRKDYSISQDVLDLAEKVVDHSKPHQLNKLSWKSKAEQVKDNGFSQFKGDQRMG
uniref:Uncharacterized protein n=1 Tax=Romanomermis culicivorax TaxID=13658 RepID=A0A915KMG9_ROMCU